MATGILLENENLLLVTDDPLAYVELRLGSVSSEYFIKQLLGDESEASGLFIKNDI